jgi:hypothetical protein
MLFDWILLCNKFIFHVVYINFLTELCRFNHLHVGILTSYLLNRNFKSLVAFNDDAIMTLAKY